MNLFRWLNYFSTALLGSNPESQIQSKFKILNSPNFKSAELKTLEWITFNPDFLIRISTVETFHFSP